VARPVSPVELQRFGVSLPQVNGVANVVVVYIGREWGYYSLIALI
jgi:hypothetical protein